MMNPDNMMEQEMKALADQVREYFPSQPESAFSHFHTSYPKVVAVTLVSLAWNYMEFEAMMRPGLKFTRPIERSDIDLFNSPFIKN